MSKVALVTGGAVRVGRALSLGLAEAGWDVAVHYHTSDAAAQEVVREIEALGRRGLALQGDLGSGSGVDAVAGALRDGFGRLDLLVNSASTFEAAPLLEVDEAAWDRVMAVNLKGPFLLVKATADLLDASQGSVVNVLDLSAFQPWTGRVHHAVSKAGLLHLTRILAKELAPRVRVNAVAPGTVLPPEGFSPEDEARERARTPLGRTGSPEDVLDAVLFLARTPFVTGEVLRVDGGRHLAF